jgi:hypothetical protein
MLWLGDWQLHRAESGNQLSWAYTFEWPLFAIFGVYFWAKTLRDEFRSHASSGAPPATGVAGATGESAAPGNSAAMEDSAGPAPDAVAQAAAADAYVERLKAEVRGHGGWHGWR